MEKLSLDTYKKEISMLTVILRTLILYGVLEISMKLMGKRQIGEFEMGELVTTLFISELAALPIGDPEIPLLRALVPLGIVVLLEVSISFLSMKCRAVRRFIAGKPSHIIVRGVLDQKELFRQRISCAELLAQLRQKGVSDISEVYSAIIEDDGMLSVFTNADVPNGITHSVIIDGVVIDENLSAAGKGRDFIEQELRKRRLSADDVFLLTVDDGGNVKLIKKAQ